MEIDRILRRLVDIGISAIECHIMRKFISKIDSSYFQRTTLSGEILVDHIMNRVPFRMSLSGQNI